MVWYRVIFFSCGLGQAAPPMARAGATGPSGVGNLSTVNPTTND